MRAGWPRPQAGARFTGEIYLPTLEGVDAERRNDLAAAGAWIAY